MIQMHCFEMKVKSTSTLSALFIIHKASVGRVALILWFCIASQTTGYILFYKEILEMVGGVRRHILEIE